MPANPVDREPSGHAAVFTGRGNTATPRGAVTAYHPGPPPEPATLATLPVGRRLLTATTEHDFHTAFADFVTGWRAGGFGDATCDTTDPPPTPATCPPADGEETRGSAGTAYTFDNGQVLYYIPAPARSRTTPGQWHTITLTGNTRTGPVVELTPATRRYGESYPDTAALDLPGLAVWIMAELTRLGRDNASAVWPHVCYAATVNTARAEIRLYLYGLDDTPGIDPEPTAADHRAFAEITTVAAAHDWTNPHDDWDRRYHLHLHVVGAHEKPALRAQGRCPGTVTVVDDPHAVWS